MKKIDKVKQGPFVLISGSLALLEKQLRSDETPLIVVQCYVEDNPGVFAATDQRVICVGKFFFSNSVKDVPYSKLSSISLESGLLYSAIKLEFSGGKMEVKRIDKKVVKAVVDIINAQLDKKDQPATTPPPPAAAPTGDDLYTKLNKLADLKERGILTQDEFDAEKKKLLNL